MYELKMTTFENGQREDFLGLLKNFKTSIDGTGTTTVAVRINYLRTMLHLYVGPASVIPKLIHYRVVLFHTPDSGLTDL